VGKRTWLLSAVVLTQACMFEPDMAPIEMHAYRCSQAGQDTCQVPGDEIVPGSLPPLNEAFMVIAKYKGAASRWSLIYPSKNVPGLLDSMVVEVAKSDSAAVWINLLGAKDGMYIERVSTAKSVPDSMVWEFGWRRSPPAQMRLGSPIAVGLVQ